MSVEVRISFLFLVCFLAEKTLASNYITFVPKPIPLNPNDDYGEPLFLTPYIEDGDFVRARNLSKVEPLDGIDVTSYAGYITVNKTHNSNLFFWYIESKAGKEAPLLLWLQGGPGWPSVYGLLTEHGPFYVIANMTLQPREYAWSNVFNMLYVDSPVQTGFSFTEAEEGFATDETDVARDLYTLLQQFFTLFDYLRTNDFYVTGESYAGKYVPAISHKIHVENEAGSQYINMKGVSMGNPLFECETMMRYGDYLYNAGLLDEIALNLFRGLEDTAIQAIKDEDWETAITIFEKLVLDSGSYFNNLTGLNNHYNYLRTNDPPELSYFTEFLAQARIRKAIHVGNLTFNDGNAVNQHLRHDIVQSIRPWLIDIIENYPTMIYSGQVDVIIPTPNTEVFINSLDWSGASEYKETTNQIWKVEPDDEEVAGYIRQAGNLRFVVIRDSGHMVPTDQPRVAYRMINNFINNKSFV